MRKFLLLLAVLNLFPVAAALANGGLDQNALEKARALLQNPNVLQGNGNADEQAAVKAVEGLTKGVPGGERRMEGLSSDILSDVMKQTNGDPAKVQELLLKAQANPKGFIDSLSPAQRDQLRNLASDIDKAKASKP